MDPEQAEPTVIDKTIEDRAVRFVIGQERHFGREARDTRRQPGAADVASGDRVIEIKASSGWAVRENGLLYVTGPQLRRASDPNFYLYIVENVSQGDPSKIEIRVLHGEDLQRLFAGARPDIYYVPVRKGDYRKLPKLEQ
jgi:hypothetical protein